MKLCIFFECIDRKSAVDAGAAADFLRHQRAEAGKGSVDCLCGSHRFRADEIEKFFFCDRERIFLILRVRNEPGAARKNLTDRTHVGGNMFDTVKDRIVLLTEDQVAVFSHDLHNQLLAADIAEFVQMLELKNKNTLESRLGNGENAGAADAFAEQHTEIRCGHRAGLIVVRQVDQRKRSTCREEKTVNGTVVFYCNHQLVVFRLCDLVDLSADDGLIQFLCNICNGNSIKSHRKYLLCLKFWYFHYNTEKKI